MDIEFDTSELERIRFLVTPSEYKKIVRGALSYAAKAAKPAAAKEITSRYSIPSARVKEDIAGPYITNDFDPSAQLYFSRVPPTAMQFKPRATATGLAVSFFRGTQTNIKDGFLQTKRNGQRLPFKPDKTKRYKLDAKRSKPRYGLQVVHGPSIGSIYTGQSKFGDAIRSKVDARIVEMFSKGLERSYGAMMRGFGK